VFERPFMGSTGIHGTFESFFFLLSTDMMTSFRYSLNTMRANFQYTNCSF
jgi:hypothetical protein